MKSTNAVKTIEALEARIHFGSVMDEVEKKNTRFLVSKRGKYAKCNKVSQLLHARSLK